MDLNKAMIIGRLTRDPELRTIPSGVQVANFAVATNRIYTDSSSNRQQLVEFHEIVVWRRLAEIAAQYLRKGGKVYIEGRLQTRSWDDPNGFKRYKTEIVAENLIMLDRPPVSGEGGGYQPSGNQPTGGTHANIPAENQKHAIVSKEKRLSGTPAVQDDLPTIDVEDEEEISVEDIPF